MTTLTRSVSLVVAMGAVAAAGLALGASVACTKTSSVAGDGGVTVVTATSTPVSDGFVSQSVACPSGQVALGGGASFTDGTGAPRDGMVFSSVPTGDPPAGWAASGSTQYTTTGGLGAADRLQVYAVCAARDGLSVATSASGTLAGDFVSMPASCPDGQIGFGGGAMFTATDGGPRDGMLMNDGPSGTPPTGWAATGSVQYTTTGGQGVGDRMQVSVICSSVDAGSEVVTAMSTPADAGFLTQSVACPAGQSAVAGGVSFTDATGAGRDGMLMNSVPVGSPPTSWAVTGSTQYATTGGQGIGDRMRVFAVCVP